MANFHHIFAVETQLGHGNEQSSVLNRPPVETLASSARPDAVDVCNKAELRARESFEAKLGASLHREASVAPLPLHDFTRDDADTMQRVFSKSGVPGRRMLRLRPELAPQNSRARCNEPEGARTNPDEIEKVLEEREGNLVYRCTFQDLPRDTPASVMHRLDSQHVDGSNLHENVTALRPFYTPESDDDTVLVFESRFESGNLFTAHQVAPFEYDLKLNNDTATNGHTQWFYFSVSNTRKGIKYTFNINNMLKPDSLYNHGLRPLIYSLAKYREESAGWHRAGEKILYYGNKISAAKKGAHCHTLTFTIVFPHDYDTCYLSHCYPYTYGDLQLYLDQLELNSECRPFIRRKVLCETEAGNKCDVLTITSRSGDDHDMKRKRGIVISARVHPGETNASWMMKGCIDYLLSDEEVARELRRKFVFKIVPMLCPDGVINGNYRCGIVGHDMNRRWAKPSPKQHSTIYHAKLMIEEMLQEREVVLFCDLHGHSRKKNVFLYGCDARFWNSKLNNSPAPSPLSERIFPLLMQENSESFAFRNCRFKVQKSKASTSRVVCWRQMGIHNSYTIEASFCGPDDGGKNGIHFDIVQLEAMGKCICLSIHSQFGKDDVLHEQLLQRVLDEPLPESCDADSDSDDSSSDDELIEKTSFKTKLNKLQSNTRGRNTPECPPSATENLEKELIKESIQPAASSRKIQPRLTSARPAYRPGSHRRPTFSARARTAEPRQADAIAATTFKDRLREIESCTALPKSRFNREMGVVGAAQTATATAACVPQCTSMRWNVEHSTITDRLVAGTVTAPDPESTSSRAENAADSTREHRQDHLDVEASRKAKGPAEELRWLLRPPRTAVFKEEDKVHRSPLLGHQDVHSPLETVTPNKTLHTVLFNADLPEGSVLDSRRHVRNFRTPSPVRKLSALFSQSQQDLRSESWQQRTVGDIKSTSRPSSAHPAGRGSLGSRGQRSPSPDLRDHGFLSPAHFVLGQSESPVAAAHANASRAPNGSRDRDAGTREAHLLAFSRAASGAPDDPAGLAVPANGKALRRGQEGGLATENITNRAGFRSKLCRDIDFIRSKVASTVDLRYL